MQALRKKRLKKITFLLFGMSLFTGLILYALRQNISLYYTPTQLTHLKISGKPLLRIGGIVAKNSVRYLKSAQKLSFVITDHHKSILVFYCGLLPSLFREGQGIVAQGYLLPSGCFSAKEVLAKHDATYHPPGVKLS